MKSIVEINRKNSFDFILIVLDAKVYMLFASSNFYESMY